MARRFLQPTNLNLGIDDPPSESSGEYNFLSYAFLMLSVVGAVFVLVTYGKNYICKRVFFNDPDVVRSLEEDQLKRTYELVVKKGSRTVGAEDDEKRNNRKSLAARVRKIVRGRRTPWNGRPSSSAHRGAGKPKPTKVAQDTHQTPEQDEENQQINMMDQEDENTCPICLEEFEDNDEIVTTEHCCHTFHSACMLEWLLAKHTHRDTKNSCPVCRSEAFPMEVLVEAALEILQQDQQNTSPQGTHGSNNIGAAQEDDNQGDIGEDGTEDQEASGIDMESQSMDTGAGNRYSENEETMQLDDATTGLVGVETEQVDAV